MPGGYNLPAENRRLSRRTSAVVLTATFAPESRNGTRRTSRRSAGAGPPAIHERLPEVKRLFRVRLRRLLLCRGDRLPARRAARRRRPVLTGLSPSANLWPLPLLLWLSFVSSVHRIRALVQPTYSFVRKHVCRRDLAIRGGHTISSGAGGPIIELRVSNVSGGCLLSRENGVIRPRPPLHYFCESL